MKNIIKFFLPKNLILVISRVKSKEDNLFMYILGLNAYHGDCSACLFKNDTLIAAIEEENTRIKHSAGFPIKSIEYCLKEAKIKISDIDYVAINRNPNLRIFNKIKYALKNFLKLKNLSNRFQNFKKINKIENVIENVLTQN